MNRVDIQNCKDSEKLQKLCLEMHNQLSVIGEILIQESKWEITGRDALYNIRQYLVNHQGDLEAILNSGVV